MAIQGITREIKPRVPLAPSFNQKGVNSLKNTNIGFSGFNASQKPNESDSFKKTSVEKSQLDDQQKDVKHQMKAEIASQKAKNSAEIKKTEKHELDHKNTAESYGLSTGSIVVNKVEKPVELFAKVGDKDIKMQENITGSNGGHVMIETVKAPSPNASMQEIKKAQHKAEGVIAAAMAPEDSHSDADFKAAAGGKAALQGSKEAELKRQENENKIQQVTGKKPEQDSIITPEKLDKANKALSIKDDKETKQQFLGLTLSAKA